jgi:uncharacterized protein (TIGR02118 family)
MSVEGEVTYFVRYRGLPQPQDGFEDYYRTRHSELLMKMPGLRRLVLHTPMSWHDAFPVTPDGTDFLAAMTFADAAAFKAAVESRARAIARDDLANLARGGASITHQAMRSLRVR